MLLPVYKDIIVFYLCSTSNHNMQIVVSPAAILSFISVLHQTTTRNGVKYALWHCLLSLFYIKPQLPVVSNIRSYIVFYLCSTSNHNFGCRLLASFGIVFYLCSTSNHNSLLLQLSACLIVFYLCSTSNHNQPHGCVLLFLIVFYLCSTSNHNRSFAVGIRRRNCLLSLFYIKPQPIEASSVTTSIVFYLCSTSNHNAAS